MRDSDAEYATVRSPEELDDRWIPCRRRIDRGPPPEVGIVIIGVAIVLVGSALGAVGFPALRPALGITALLGLGVLALLWMWRWGICLSRHGIRVRHRSGPPTSPGAT